MLQSDVSSTVKEIDFKCIEKIANTIGSNFYPDKIILFGSYSKVTHTPDSDVDLLIIMDTESTIDTSVEISLFLKHTIPLDIIVKTPEEIKRRIKLGDFFITDIIENGKVLYERSCH